MPLSLPERIELLEAQVEALLNKPSDAFTFDVIMDANAQVPLFSPLQVELASVTFEVAVPSNLRIPHFSVDFEQTDPIAVVKIYHDDISPVLSTRHQIDAVSNGTGTSQLVTRQNTLRELGIGTHRIFAELEGEPQTSISAGRLHIEVIPIGEAL